MSIKSDKWIRRMAQEQNMIEPFEANQVRFKGDEKIISYGTSSYGYDVRCAREFKVFTNVHSAIVDPKNFDERSFIDIDDGMACLLKIIANEYASSPVEQAPSKILIVSLP